MEVKRMAPVNKVKTYGRSNRNIVNSSVDAINILFAKNKAKVRQNKKRRLVVKELPQRPRGETLLVDDSFHVSTEDTFDKLTRKNGFDKATHTHLVKDDSNFSKSVKHTNSFYSPIMTRRRKRTASIIEESSSLISNKTQAKKFKGNRSCSVIPHLLEPTVDKIDVSLEVEKVQKHVPNSLSYIKLPDINEGEDPGTSKCEISFDPLFTKTFREKQMIHSSTPVMPMRKEKIVNHTISPITNLTFPEKSVRRVRNINSDVSLPKNLSQPGNSESINIDGNSRNKSFGDWKLKSLPNVLLTMCNDIVRNHKFPESLGSIHNSYCNIKSREEASNSDTTRRSFITLRRRRVLKQLESSKRGKKSSNRSTVTSFKEPDKNLTMSLDEFNSFVDKLNQNENRKSHSLCDFESFMVQNKNLLGVIDNIETSKKKESEMETPVNFVTKRRRRLTDSCLSSEKSSRRVLDIPSRRLSLEGSCQNIPQIKDVVVILPRIKVNLPHNETDSYDMNSLIPIIDKRNSFLQFDDTHNSVSETSSCQDKDAVFSTVNHHHLKDLVVNLTNANVAHDTKVERNSVNNAKGVLECSGSLFEKSDSDVHNSILRQSESSRTKTDLLKRSSLTDKSKMNEVQVEKNIGHTKSNRTMKISNKLKRSNKSVIRNNETSKYINKNPKSASQSPISESEKVRNKSQAVNSSNRNSNKGENCVENGKDTVPNNISATDFENFFVTTNKQQSVNSRQVSTSAKSKPNNLVSNFEKFEKFYIGVSQNSDQLRPQSNESNSVISETNSENLNQVQSLKTFEDFFSDVMRSTSESETDKFVLNDDRSNADTDEDKGQTEVVINLIKSPWRGKNSKPKENITIENSISPAVENDLREDKKSPLKREMLSSPILINDSHSVELSDIVESSLQETSDVDHDGFKIPTIGSVRRRQSKTLLLKAGKLWRRSLSIYRRSSMMLSLMNAGTCIARDGSYCVCPKCNTSRESKQVTGRRCSIRIVPTSPAIDLSNSSILETYAHRTCYVSDPILEDNLENNLRSLSISRRRTSVIQNSAPVTARELVLRRCGQSEPIPFEQCYPKSVLHHCQKIGEGVYGEVFLFRNPNGGTSVMKVIPIEGDLIVNGERQKKYEEIFSEMIIAQELSNLRNNKLNTTSGFAEVQKVQCVQGRYPEKLLDLWELYDETRGSENDSPEVFGDEQLYIVLQLANGGQDLEAFIFNNSLQAYAMFQQVACTLAIAEDQLHFEHRDLHWGNVLLSAVDKNKKVNFRLDGKNYEVPSKGVEVSIIDFTLSRIEYDGVVIFNDLGLDPDLFTAEGDYQFEIYKLMQKKNGNNWQRFEPYTNILWLHYILDKAVTALRYKNVQSKIHKEYVSKLKQLKNDILSYASVKEFVLNHF